MRLVVASLFCLLAWPLAVADERSDVAVSGESRNAATRLAEAGKLIRQKKWPEATTLLQSLTDSGAELAPLADGRLVQARLEAQRLLTQLPPEALKDYRRRAEAQAARLLKQGIDDSDPAPLLRVVEEAFCTAAALTALDRLGDLAFERGRFAEAELWWSLVAPLTARAGEGELRYPDPPDDVAARAKAKQLLARLFAGRPSFEADLAAFAKAYPKVEGRLAGKKGTYAETLAAVAKERAARPAEEAGDWPTFAGDASRQKVVAAGDRLLDRLAGLARGGPTWIFDLESRKSVEEEPALPKGQKPVDAARRMAFHPAVVGDRALIADNRCVTAYDLRTGKATELFDLAGHVKGFDSRPSTPCLLDVRNTLTVAEDGIFVRLGCASVRDVRPEAKTKVPRESGASFLVALSLKGEKRWLASAIDPVRKEYAVFEGAPIVESGRVWIAASRFDNDRVVTAIHCYSASSDEQEPVPLWRTDVVTTRELPPAGGHDLGGQRRDRLHLLTLAGPRVVYCSHSGLIVALDAQTGKRAWALRYAQRDLTEPEDEPALRDLVPCVFADGKLYAAPVDGESLYCLDVMTGEVIWQRERLEPVSLLGVGKGRLIFTTYRNPRQGRLYAGGLRAVGAEDGTDKDGWELPDEGGGLTPMGRGLLIGDLVLWPTGRSRCSVVAVRQEDGRQADNPSLLHRVPSGNLVYANGSLVVCGQRTMWAFVPPEKLSDEVDKVALESPRTLLRLARASAARKEPQAIERYDAVLKQTGAADRFLREARRERQQVMLANAEAAIDAKKKDEASEWLASALKGATGRAKLDALVRAAVLWEKAGEEAAAARVWRQLVGEDGLVEDATGLPQRAGWVASRRLALKGEVKQVSKPSRGGEPLVFPLRQVTTLTLPSGERYLDVSADGASIFSLFPGELVCRDVSKGEVRWRSTTAVTPSWLADLGDRVVVAGADGIACFEASKGGRAWEFAAPERRRHPCSATRTVRVPRDVEPGGELSRFHLVGSDLVFVQGRQTLFGMDARSGEVLWMRRPPDAGLGLPHPHGRVHHVVPWGEGLLVQVSGRRWLLSASTGKLIAQARDAVEPWPSAVPLPDGGALVVVNDSRVERLDGGKLEPRWTFTPQGKTTRTGAPPLVVADGKNVVAVVPENLGLRLVNLDADRGEAKWSKLIEGDPGALRSYQWALGDRLYSVEGGSLRAHSLADGKIDWARSLPDQPPWRLSLSGKTLLAWPEQVKAMAFQFRRGAEALQWNVSPWPEGDAVLPLWCFDTGDGEPIQRINLPADLPVSRTVRRKAERGLFPSFEVGFALDDGPTLRFGRRVVFGLGRQIRVLDNGEPPEAKK